MDRHLWKHAILPLAVVTVLYAVISFCFYFLWLPYLLDFCRVESALPEGLAWLQSLINGSVWLINVLLISGMMLWLFSNVYSMCCDVLFDPLVAAYEKKTYGAEPRSRTLSVRLGETASAVWFAVKTAILSPLLLFLYLIPVPFAGEALRTMLLGYRFGISYLETPAFFRELSMYELRDTAWHHARAQVFGFGILAYLSLLIPVLPILLFPGFAIGGTMLFHEAILPHVGDDPTPPQNSPPPGHRLEDRCFYN